MSVEIKVRIKTAKFDTELTQDEAKALFEELKLIFEPTRIIEYIPLAPNPYFLKPPYEIGDFPITTPNTGYPPQISYIVCSSQMEY